MSGVSDAPELSLISESVENANARIRLFRIAFGAAGTGSMIGNSEIRSILNDFFRGNRIKIGLAHHPGSSACRNETGIPFDPMSGKIPCPGAVIF